MMWVFCVAALLIGAEAVPLAAQSTQKRPPTFSLSIAEDPEAMRTDPDLHRILIDLKRIVPGYEIDMFHKEEEGMYDFIVLHDGLRVRETDAMRDLRAYRKADRDHAFPNPRFLRMGEAWTTPFDLSDYYDMTSPGSYQVTATRESLPLNMIDSTLVYSNRITIFVRNASTVQQRVKPKPRFEIIASLDDPDAFYPVIHVERTNISKSPIYERKCWVFYGLYNLAVIYNGNPLEPNNRMRELQKSRANVDCPGNETLNEIDPGELDADDLPVSNFFDLTRPGAYAVYVTRETYPWNPLKSVTVESSPVRFVVPELPPETNSDQTDESTPKMELR